MSDNAIEPTPNVDGELVVREKRVARFGGPNSDYIALGSRCDPGLPCERCLCCNDDLIVIENDFIFQTLARYRRALQFLKDAIECEEKVVDDNGDTWTPKETLEEAMDNLNGVADLVSPFAAWAEREEKRGSPEEPLCIALVFEFTSRVDRIIALHRSGVDFRKGEYRKELLGNIEIFDGWINDELYEHRELVSACVDSKCNPPIGPSRAIREMMNMPAILCFCEKCSEKHDKMQTLDEYMDQEIARGRWADPPSDGLDERHGVFRWRGKVIRCPSTQWVDIFRLLEKNHKEGIATRKRDIVGLTSQESFGKVFNRTKIGTAAKEVVVIEADCVRLVG